MALGQINGGNLRAAFSVCASVSPELHPRAGRGLGRDEGTRVPPSTSVHPGSPPLRRRPCKQSPQSAHSNPGPSARPWAKPCRPAVGAAPASPPRCRRHPHHPCEGELNLMRLSERRSRGRLGVRERTLRGSVQPPPSTPTSVLAGLGVGLGGTSGFWKRVPGLLSLPSPAFSNSHTLAWRGGSCGPRPTGVNVAVRAVLAAGLGASLPRASESEVISGRRPSASEAGTSSSPRQRVCDPTENTLSALFEFPKKRGPAQSSRIPGSQNGSRNFAQSAPRPRAVNSLPRGLATSGPRGAGQEPTGSSRPRLQRVPTHEGLALRWGDFHGGVTVTCIQ